MPKSVIIVGGGVIGLCTAYYASLRGWDVTIIERASDAHEGCSFGNAGLIVPSHVVPLSAPGMVALGLKWMWKPESPFYIKPRFDWQLLSWGWKFWRACTTEHVQRAGPLLRDLHMASRECFKQLAKATANEFQLVQRGLLNLCKTERALHEEAQAAEHARHLGIPAEVLDAKQTVKLDPAIRMDIAGAVYFPKDCHLTPGRFMRVMRQELSRRGARILWKTEARNWRTHAATVDALVIDDDDLTADEFVLCGGSWTPEIAGKIGLRLPMQAGKGYSITLAKPKQLPSISAILTEARVAVTPMDGKLRFGGTMEIAGLNEAINPVRVRGIINSVSKYYPDFHSEDFQGVEPWCGLRPCSPDGLPYVGRTSRWKNLTIATGHAMMGLSLGPITGRLISEILSGESPSIPIDLLNPDRYA